MVREPGFYLTDEPEAALSFTSCLRLVNLLYDLAESGAQVICATHSPVLAATPGADIIEVGEHGFRRTKWEDLALGGLGPDLLGDAGGVVAASASSGPDGVGDDELVLGGIGEDLGQQLDEPGDGHR
ncbi:AAA family ATPase [Saccharothrix longispora]|uniref:AAA family ATPase n=1 Tax=Saccharothrix longispora TaxID=33920 RepID=UPI00286A3381|nr:AAA family ATPase [Saccharothrix longispora]